MTIPLEAVRRHTWAGYRCESRLVRARAPRLEPVLMIGGAFQRKDTWGRLEREFLASMDTFTVDPPGWGAGDLLPDEHGADLLADAVAHMLDESGIGPVHVLAGSYGTAIAYRLAHCHPDRVRRMVLVGTMPEIPEHARAIMRDGLELLADRRMPEFAEATLAVLMNHERAGDIRVASRVRAFLRRRLLNLPEDEIEQTFANTRRLLEHRMVDTTRPPACPVLVTTGEHDHFTTPARCRELAATCPDSWFAEIADADHLVHLERTTDLADLAVRFYAGEPVEGLPYLRRAERVRDLRPGGHAVAAGWIGWVPRPAGVGPGTCGNAEDAVTLAGPGPAVEAGLRAAARLLDPATAGLCAPHLGPADGPGDDIRSRLVLWSAGALGLPERDAVPGAVALELLDRAARLHDTGPGTRANRPGGARGEVPGEVPGGGGRGSTGGGGRGSSGGGSGGSSDGGTADLVAAGDALVALAIQVLVTARRDATARACDLVARTLRGLVAGRYRALALDGLPWHGAAGPGPDDYLAAAGARQATLLAAATSVGATLTGARRDITDHYAGIGHRLGLARQIAAETRDLGATGGAAGRTWPLVWAAAGGGALADRIAALLQPPCGDADLALAAKLAEEAGAREAGRDAVREHVRAALGVARELPMPLRARTALAEIADHLARSAG